MYKSEILSFYKESTTLFRGNQNIRYWSYCYIHPQAAEQYQITLQDAKTHLDNWIETRGQGWEFPSSGPEWVWVQLYRQSFCLRSQEGTWVDSLV